MVEAKTGEGGQNKAERQNAHNAGIAVNAITALQRAASKATVPERLTELLRKPIVFLVSHNDRQGELRYEVNRISSSRPTGIDKHKPYNSTLNLHETTSQDHRARTKPALAALPTPSPPSPTTSNSTLDPQITGDLYHTAAGPRASKDIEAAGSSPGARDETIGRADEATNIETTSLASCAGMDVRLVERLLG
ncbi:MAG: hypothetical protein LQ339_005552 [Xanthoria mediterranea]|nr:MAG: hypothetical protein LQ339_005552 [Xanthoria mediterranea]